MIRLKISLAGKRADTEFKIYNGERLSDAVERSLVGLIPNETKSDEHFVALVNGYVIDSKLWESVELKESDTVLIAPKITEGEGGGIIKMAAIIAVTYYSGGVLAPFLGFAAGGVGAAFIAAGASIATSLLLNSLFPPPVPEGLNLGSGSSVASSQMYAITGQSNSVRKLQTVIKMYGTHRVFPSIAANPYTEFEADPVTGKLNQYFYCVYDFGLGPVEVSEIKIGDTPLTDFTDFSYNLVDFNKPAISEGPWDDATINTLQYYKGDIERDSVSVAIDKDKNLSIPAGDYQVTRNAAPNTTGLEQEIILTMLCQQGLYSFHPNGTKGTATILLDIEFSKTTENIWRGFNDLNYVREFKQVGGTTPYSPVATTLYPLLYSYTYLGQPAYVQHTAAVWGQINSLNPGNIFAPDPKMTTNSTYTTYYGLDAGTNKIFLANNPNIVGKYIRIGGEIVGAVVSGTAVTTGNGLIDPFYSVYTLDRPLTKKYVMGYTQTIFFNNPPGLGGTGFVETATIVAEGLATGKAQIVSDQSSAVYSTFSFVPLDLTADYKIRVTRTLSFGQYTETVRSEMSWAGITTRVDRNPILSPLRHTFLELKIRATNQLNGTVQNLSAVCQSVLDTWDGSQWVKQATSNPAWVFADLLTGEVNSKAVSKDRLDTTSILEWADFCDAIPTPPMGMTYYRPRYETNIVVDYAPTLQTLLGQVCGASQASLNLIDGKYGVLIDKLRTTPVQIFTPRNSSGFSATRNYSLRPHALKVSFVDPAADWEVREAIVYDTGYDENNSTEFQELTSYGCTNYEQAWRYGRYALFSNRLRQETITINVDFEHLVCTRGDYVQITQDVMKVGGTPARVKSISGTVVTIDEGIDTGPFSYGYTFRAKTGEIYTDTLTVVDSDEFDLDGTLPQVGDLIVIGKVGQITLDCIVKSIQPSDGLNATLTLIEKADAIYTSESSDTIPAYLANISDTANADFDAPTEVEGLIVSDYNFECNGSGLTYVVSLAWEAPLLGAVEFYEVYVDYGSGYELADQSKQKLFSYDVLPANIGAEHTFKVLGVSSTGKKLDLGAVGEVSQVATRKTDPPSDVTALNIDITGETVQFFWINIPDCSAREYLIRYSPELDGTWDRSIPLLRAPSTATTAFSQARTGTYLIKAVDWEDNESLNAAIAITTIPNLFGLNIISTTTDFPTLEGTKVRVEKLVGGLILASEVPGDVNTNQFYLEGYYYYENLLNLGEIFTVRLQSQIQAEGLVLSDFMSNWITLSSVLAMSNAGSADWDVETQYRTTNQFNVIADWVSLTSIDPISEGNQDLWTPWRKFFQTDATGRIFQFRLRLVSNLTAVTPRVFDGTIRADMPDRIESYNNLVAPNTGYTVTYTPAFMGPGTSPNIQISIDGASSGDYWLITGKSLNGFTITFYDKNDVAVGRTFDAAVKGYGRKATSII